MSRQLNAPFIAILLRTMDSIRLMGFIAMGSSRILRGRPTSLPRIGLGN